MLFRSKISAAIDVVKLADGSVSNTKFQYINSLIGNAQNQINDKKLGFSISDATQIVINTTTPTIICSISITPRKTSNKILLIASGDMNVDIGGNWHKLQFYRDSSAIGKFIVAVGDNNSTNTPFALTHVDSPNTTNSITYSVKANQGNGSCTYGESGDGEAPTIVAIEFEPN